jgi:hypothetical protein
LDKIGAGSGAGERGVVIEFRVSIEPGFQWKVLIVKVEWNLRANVHHLAESHPSQNFIIIIKIIFNSPFFRSNDAAQSLLKPLLLIDQSRVCTDPGYLAAA